jgi:hypothetical protein
VKTDTLEDYINDYLTTTDPTASDDTEPETEVEEEAAPESKLPDVKTAPHPEAVEWFYMGLKAMLKSNLLYTDDLAVIADLTTELYKRLIEEKPQISDDDIDDLIASI